MKKFFILSIVSVFIFPHFYAQKLSEDTKVSVLTIGKGSELHALFGHTALRIKDENLGFDIVYNFGYFDFNTPYFYFKFVKGDLLYHAEIEEYSQLLYYYNYVKRSVKEQELNLTLLQKQALIDQLNQIIQTDEKYYIYKFIDDNCTTRVQEAVANVSKTPLEKVKDTNISYREIINTYLGDRYFEKLGINIIFGTRVDVDAKKLFLPDELFDSIENKSINNKTSIVLSNEVIEPAPWWNTSWVMMIFLILIVLLNKKWLTNIFLTFLGLIGLFFMFIGFFSLHQEVLWNYNVLLFNPILIAIAISSYSHSKKLFKRLKQVFYIFVLVYFFYMLNKAHLLIMLPFIILMPLIVLRLYKKNKFIALS